MWFYNNVPYMCEPIDIIHTLRRQTSELGIDVLREIKPMEEAIMFTCPWHKNGMERKPSCGFIIRKKKDGLPVGSVHCFGCRKLTTLEEFISNCFNVYDGGLYGAKWLSKTFTSADVDERSQFNLSDITAKALKRENINPLIQPQITYVSEEELDSYRYIHPYMYYRKLTDEIINMFDIGYDMNTQCITFPIHDENGNVLFIARRSVNTKYFNYPNAAVKPLYGLYQLRKYGGNINEVILTESMINCCTCWGYGRPALALNGTGSSKQLKDLSKLPYRKFILGLDPDEAGDKGTQKIYDELKGSKIVTKLIIPKNKDINDLSYQEFVSLPEIFMTDSNRFNLVKEII